MATRHSARRRPPVTIAVLGSANMDLVVRQPRLPRPGETLFGSSFTAVPGGKGLNQAVAAARAGGRVRFAGAVGDDEFGAALRARLAADGVDTAALATVGAPTGVAAVSVVDGGENSIVVVPGANQAVMALDDATRDLIARSGLLVAQFERPLGLVGEALAAARARGVTTVLTPAPVLPVPADLLELVDILVPNAAEACELAGTDDEGRRPRAEPDRRNRGADPRPPGRARGPRRRRARRGARAPGRGGRHHGRRRHPRRRHGVRAGGRARP